MLTQIELNALHAQMEAHHQLVEQLPKITTQLNCIVGSLEVMGSSDAKWQPKEDPAYCMTFDEWAQRMDSTDRRRLMNFLWNSKEWHATCLREEEAPWNDPDKEMPPLAPRYDGSNEQPDAFGPSEDELPF